MKVQIPMKIEMGFTLQVEYPEAVGFYWQRYGGELTVIELRQINPNNNDLTVFTIGSQHREKWSDWLHDYHGAEWYYIYPPQKG